MKYLSHVSAYLHFRVIGSHSISDQTKRHRILLIHVYHRIFYLVQEPISCIESCWTRPNDRYTEWTVTTHCTAVVPALSKERSRTVTQRAPIDPSTEMRRALCADIGCTTDFHGV